MKRSGAKRVRQNGKPAKSGNVGVPYENATPVQVMARFTVLSIEFYAKISALLEQLERRSQKQAKASLGKSRDPSGAKRVRKRKPRPG